MLGALSNIFPTLGPPGPLPGALSNLFPSSWGLLGPCCVFFPTSFQPLGALRGVLPTSWGLLRPCWVLFPTSFQSLGGLPGLARYSFQPLSNRLGPSGGLQGLCQVLFPISFQPLGAFWALAGCSFQHLGALDGCPFQHLSNISAFRALPGALSNIFPTPWGFSALAGFSFQPLSNFLKLPGPLQGFLSDLLGPSGPSLGALSNIFPIPWGLPGRLQFHSSARGFRQFKRITFLNMQDKGRKMSAVFF